MAIGGESECKLRLLAPGGGIRGSGRRSRPGFGVKVGTDNYRSCVYEQGRERKEQLPRSQPHGGKTEARETRRVSVRRGEEPDKSAATVADVAADFLSMIEGQVAMGEMSPRTHANYSQRWGQKRIRTDFRTVARSVASRGACLAVAGRDTRPWTIELDGALCVHPARRNPRTRTDTEPDRRDTATTDLQDRTTASTKQDGKHAD